VMIARCDTDGRYRFVNTPFAARFGLEPHDVVGRTIREVLGEPAYATIERYLDVVLRGERVEFEVEVPYQAIGLQLMHVAYDPEFDEGRRVCGFFATVINITASRRAANALRQSEERFARFMQHLPGLAWIKDVDGRYVYANDAAVAAFATPRERLYGKKDLDVFPPETAAHFQANDRKALARGAGVQVVETLEQDDGVVHHSLVSKFPIPGHHGRPVLVGGMAIDITEQIRAEETILTLLRISERLTATLDVDMLLDVLVQEAIRLVEAESGVAGLLAPEGMTAKKYFQKDEVVPLECRWAPMQGLPGWLIVHKTPYLTNDVAADAQVDRDLCERLGVRTALSTPILSARGEVLGFFEVHNKRTLAGFGPADRELLLAVSHTAAIAIQNALAYRNLQRAEGALKEADRRKNDFLATLAHELRNPLAPLRNGLQIMRLARGDAGAVEQAQAMMERQLQQMVRLIDDLLDVSRITRGKLHLRRERVDLASAVQNAVEGSRPFIEAAAHRLGVVLPTEPVYLDADPTRLAQVFANLLTNAAKYTDRGGDIHLCAELSGREVVVTVKDSGIGIAAEHLPRLFEMFSQAAPALERAQGGLGIGLSLVKGLVEMHGGTVTARSAGAGRGSDFVVRLPLAASTIGAPVPAPPGAEPQWTSPRSRILVADDNRDAADSLALVLRLAGHEVHAVHDGQEAVEAAAWFRPEIVFLDIGMPTLNGLDAARRIREQPWGLSMILIAVTGWGQDDDKRRALEAGFDHHLTKPVAPASLDRLLAGLTSSLWE
jgi:PAS domain S-box-containing protein